MKLKRIVLVFLSGIVLLTGCSDGADKQTKVDEPSEQTERQDNAVSMDDSGFNFRNIDVTIVDQTDVHIRGEAKGPSDVIYYKVELDEVLVEETELPLDHTGEWNAFAIDLTLTDDTVESGDIPVLMLYGKDEAGNIVQPNYIGIDYVRQSY